MIHTQAGISLDQNKFNTWNKFVDFAYVLDYRPGSGNRL